MMQKKVEPNLMVETNQSTVYVSLVIKVSIIKKTTSNRAYYY